MTDSLNVHQQLTVCTLSQPGIKIIYGEKKHNLFLSLETTGTFSKTFIVEVSHISYFKDDNYSCLISHSL
jgi:hypothetical protein